MSARICELTSPVEDLRFARMRVIERLSEPFEIHLEAKADRGDIDPKQLLGRQLSIKVTWDGERTRDFSGYAMRFAYGSKEHKTFRYHLTLRPWLWFLTLTQDCRIFQEMSTPEIVKAVFQDEPSMVIDDRLTGTYKPREYCVQYRESDFAFVSRLLEEEGIYYFFEHAEGEHKLVLVDAKATHARIDGQTPIFFIADTSRALHKGDHVARWQGHRSVASGVYTIDDYDFKRPSTDLLVLRKAETQATHVRGDQEVFDYPGDYVVHETGEAYVAARIEELQTPRQVYRGTGPLREFKVGRVVEIAKLEDPAHDGDYLITETEFSISDEQYEAGAASGADFDVSFAAIRSDQQFRPPRRSRRPRIPGIQTAVVTGPAGEEIHTDQYGRIKVQFHWDRYGRNDDASSCWMRVAFLAAGPRFGFVSIPRIGHEVVVDFLEGDPDRPLVTGVVYNASNMPPWALPANKTQSGLYTRSSKGGGYDNANAIRFEDMKGSEEVWLHAERDQRIEVEHDESHWVGNDRTKTVDHDETVHVKHDRTETVDNNETITIGVDRTENVGANESVTIGRNRTHLVEASETLTVALQRTHTVGINETITVGAAQEVTVGAMRALTVGANQTTKIGANHSESVGGNHSELIGGNHSEEVGGAHTAKIGKDQSVNVGGGDTLAVAKASSVTIGDVCTVSVAKARSTSIGEDDSLSVGKNLSIEAGDSITVSTGSASISMKKDGTIVIKGKDITVDASGKITIKSSGDTKMTAAKILQN